MSSVRMTSASVSGLEENYLSKRETTRVRRRASGKAERLGSVLRSRGKRWCCNKSKCSEYCEHESDLRIIAGIHAYFAAYARQPIRQGRGEGRQNESTYACK
jgi:hypothetical protein